MPREALARVVVAVGDRLVGHVAAGHHQRLADVREQEVVQRAVREHHPELGRARGDRGGDARVAPPRREHDRPVAAAQQRRLDRAERDQPPGRLEVRRHQRERLLLAVLARPQRRDRALVGGHAREVEPADPLDRDDPRRRASAATTSSSGWSSRGPQSGQALGWAWKRRSVGSWYSASQRAHIVKPAIVVSGRSYGTPRTIVKRGPQSVQLMNG